MELQVLIKETRKLLGLSQAKEALKLLKSQRGKFRDEVEFLQIFGETYLENGKVEKAYEFLEKSCSIDTEGEYGSEKFFYLGQIIGGGKGIELIDHGIAQLTTKLESSTQDEEKRFLIKKLNQGLFAEIEIWMTDLCMEPEAESKCDELITQSLTIDETNPESWSLLASIRISQQRDQDALDALSKSWELFEIKKTNLENNSNINTGDIDTEEISIEYVELIQPLITLAKLAIEMGNYELGSVVASNIRDVDEDNIESYYLEGFANYLYIKKTQYDTKFPNYDPEVFDKFVINAKFGDGFDENLKQAKSSLSQVLKLSNQFDIDQDILQHTNQLVEELGGDYVDEEVNNIDEDNWEDEIQSDDE